MRKMLPVIGIAMISIAIIAIINRIVISWDYTLATVEITRTGKYNTSDSIANDDHTIDFIDLNTGVQVTEFKVDKDNFYTMKKGDLLKLIVYTKSDDKVRYSYSEQIDIKDIDDIPPKEVGDIQSSRIYCIVTAKKQYSEYVGAYLKYYYRCYIYDSERDKVIKLDDIERLYNAIEVGDTLVIQRDSTEYNNKTYYHYYIVYTQNGEVKHAN